MRDSYGVLHVAIRGLKLRQGVVSSQFGHIINFRIGERIYTVEKKNDCRKHWNEAFSLDLTIHQHLFNTLQVDVYEIKRLMGRQHCGRFELRIQNLIAGVTSQWYNLRKRSQLCYANLADLHLSHLDSNEDSNYTGKVLLEIFYQSGEISKNSPELPLPSIPMVPFSQISADLSTQSFDDEENALNFDLIEITLAQNNNSNEESDSEIRVRNLDPVTGVESIDMESLRNALPRVEVLKDSPASKNSRSVLFKETKNELLDFPSLNLDGSKVGGFEEGDSSTDLTGKEIIDKEGEEEEDESKNKIESYLDPKSECKTLQSKTRQELLFDWQKIDRPNFSNISGMNSFITEVSNSMDRPKLIVNSLKTNEEDMEMKKKNTSLNLNCEIESDPVSKGGRPSKTLVNNNSEQIFSLETTVMDEKTSILSHSDRGMRIKSIIKSLFSWMMDKKDREIVDDVIDLYGAFVQGVDCGRLSLAASFFLHQRFYSDIPLPFTCSLILKKNELLMSRFMFRYALSACGWPALNFFGKRSEMISGKFFFHFPIDNRPIFIKSPLILSTFSHK